jgi:thioredoxin reductase (NADPH)
MLTDEKMATSVPGLFGAGDVRQKQIRQVVTATSDGAIAVQNVLKYLEARD